MAMRKVLALSLSLVACSVQAANSVCSLTSGSKAKTVKIKGVPGFFFKAHPEGDQLAFIGDGKNYLLDLKTGEERPFVGVIDPVWSPDGKFLTTPMPAREGDMGLAFYEANHLIKNTLAGEPEKTPSESSSLGGVYQSIGVGKDDYRIITDKDGVSMAHFTYGKEGMKQTTDAKVLCPGVIGVDLPMLSKDGKYISGYDKTSQTTKIFKLDQNDNCSLALDVGFGTGKVTFNEDSSQIAFHVDQFAEFESGYFSGVSKDKVKNVVVLKVEESGDGKLIPTAWAMPSHHMKPGDGGYYPDYDKKGNLYFMEDLDNNFQVAIVPQDALEFRQMEGHLFGRKDCESCTISEAPSVTTLLAKMWSDVCSEETGKNIEKTPEFIVGIDPLKCKELVNEFYTEALGVSKVELMNACPGKEPLRPVEIGEWRPQEREQAEALLKGKCIVCHRMPKTFMATDNMTVMTGPSSFSEEQLTYKKKIDGFKLDKLSSNLAMEMLKSIKLGSMPKGDPLDQGEVKLLSDYFQKRLLDLDWDERNDYSMIIRYTDEELEKVRQQTLAGMESSPEEAKRKMVTMVNCRFGQKDCDQYVQDQKSYAELEASNRPEEEREKFIQDKIMEAKCSNLFGVTPQDCRDWERTKK